MICFELIEYDSMAFLYNVLKYLFTNFYHFKIFQESYLLKCTDITMLEMGGIGYFMYRHTDDQN